MRSFVAALVAGLAVLGGSASAQPAPDVSFSAVYAVHASGMDAGDFNYSFSRTGSSYRVTADRRMRGLIGAALNRSQDYTYSVNGAVASDGTLHPSAYQHQGGRRREDRPNGRLIRASFTPNDVVTTAEPGPPNMGDPPATPAQRRGTIDQLTAIAAMLTGPGDPCARTLRIYMDGRSRFDFVLTPNGNVNVNTRAYRGPAARCQVRFNPIAGFGDPQEPTTLTFLFAQANGLWAPVTIEMPVDNDQIRVVRLEARRLTVNGAPLR